jgi:ABC-2 type transport system ATP-binding protein
VLEASGARIAVDDVTVIERLDVSTVGSRVLVIGDAGALLAAISGAPLAAVGEGGDDGPLGEARVVAGSLRVGGREVTAGDHHAVLGAAPLDPPLPPAQSALEYVTWSARLGGADRRVARELSLAALRMCGMAPAVSRRLDALSVPERRAVVLAQAMVLSPAVIVAEAPLSGLDGAAAALVQGALAAATDGRGALVSVTRIDPASVEGTLARSASHVLMIAGGELVLDGAASEVFEGAQVYGLTVRSNTEALRAELSVRGIELRGGPLRFCATLPPGVTTREILAAAAVARAAVIELVPLL